MNKRNMMVIFVWCNPGKRHFHYTGFNVKTFWDLSSLFRALTVQPRMHWTQLLSTSIRKPGVAAHAPLTPNLGGSGYHGQETCWGLLTFSLFRKWWRPIEGALGPSLSSLHTCSQAHTPAHTCTACIYLPHTQRERQKGKKNLAKEQCEKFGGKSWEKGKAGSFEHVTSHLSNHLWVFDRLVLIINLGMNLWYSRHKTL